MSYTGYQDMKQDARKPTLPIMLRGIDRRANALGITLDLPELDQAREYQARADALRNAYREHKASTTERVTESARDYATGQTTSTELIGVVTTSATLTGETDKAAERMIEEAARTTEAEGAPLLHGISEDEWLKILRPAVAAALKKATAVADAIGINAPRQGKVGVAEHAHAWAPTASELRSNMDLRHLWERLEAALDGLDTAYAFADQLREWGLLPVVEGRAVREDYRWLRADLLEGSTGRRRELFLAHRHHAEPGIFTAAELRASDGPTLSKPNRTTTAAVATGAA